MSKRRRPDDATRGGAARGGSAPARGGLGKGPRAAAAGMPSGEGAPKVASMGAAPVKDGRLGRIHDRALDVTILLAERVPLDRALDQVFRRARDLGSAERAEITELAYAFSRGERRIDDRLSRASKKLKRDLDLVDAPVRARIRLLAHYLDQGEPADVVEARDPYAFKRIPGLFEHVLKLGPVPPKSAAHRIGIERGLSDGVAERLVRAFGEARADEIGAALLGRAPFTVRVNAMKATREEAQRRIGVPSVFTPLSPDGLIFERRVPLAQLPIFEEGWIEPQDEGSQLIARALGARPGELIYDACAGAGGKTLAIAAQMRGLGRIVAFDRDEKKIEELKRRARRAGLTNVEAKVMDFVGHGSVVVGGEERAHSTALPGLADRALVDAPCSGTGTFRRNVDARWHLTEQHLLELPERQVTLVQRAADAVKVGGLVVYATCSVLVEENEAVVREAMVRDGRLEPAPLSETLGEALAAKLGATDSLRLGPGPGPTEPDGFFIAALRRVR